MLLVLKLSEALVVQSAVNLNRLDGPSDRPDSVVCVTVEPATTGIKLFIITYRRSNSRIKLLLTIPCTMPK